MTSIASRITEALQRRTSMPRNERVTYSRAEDCRPKNSLYVIRVPEKEMAYFGIARCKLQTDVCRKKDGRELSQSRALAAKQAYETLDAAFFIDGSGLSGKIALKHMPYLNDYFFALDR